MHGLSSLLFKNDFPRPPQQNPLVGYRANSSEFSIVIGPLTPMSSLQHCARSLLALLQSKLLHVGGFIKDPLGVVFSLASSAICHIWPTTPVPL